MIDEFFKLFPLGCLPLKNFNNPTWLTLTFKAVYLFSNLGTSWEGKDETVWHCAA